MSPASFSNLGLGPVLCGVAGGLRRIGAVAGNVSQFHEQHTGQHSLSRVVGIDRPCPYGTQLHQERGGDFAERGGF